MTYLKKILQAAALAPPALKFPLFRRVLGAIVRYSKVRDEEFITNLGMNRKYSAHMAPPIGDIYLFGRPSQYMGEKGALNLCRFFSGRCRGFLDIGAHRGYFVFFVRAEAPSDVPIYFFEPNPTLFAEISRNVVHLNLQNVVGVPAAIGAKLGRTTLFMQDKTSLESTIRGEFAPSSAETFEVDITTFDAFARSKNLSNLCVKVDIEDAEFDFLEGAQSEHARIDYLIIEVLRPAIVRGFIVALKRKFGMEAYYIKEFSLEHSRDGEFDYVSPEYNWLFCRHDPAALREVLRGTRFVVKS